MAQVLRRVLSVTACCAIISQLSVIGLCGLCARAALMGIFAVAVSNIDILRFSVNQCVMTSDSHNISLRLSIMVHHWCLEDYESQAV
jgi:hypothetical protein